MLSSLTGIAQGETERKKSGGIKSSEVPRRRDTKDQGEPSRGGGSEIPSGINVDGPQKDSLQL